MKEIINLPFGESLKRTFLYLFSHLNQVWRLALSALQLSLRLMLLCLFPRNTRPVKLARPGK